MVNDHLLLVILRFLLLGVYLPISQSATPSDGIPGLFWVAADRAQCSNWSNGSDCDTLEGYWERNDVNFSLSL